MNAQDIPAVVEEIWHGVLDAPDDGSDRTFFEMNGQSVSALRIISRIEERLGISIDMEELFGDPTLEEFIRTVENKANHDG